MKKIIIWIQLILFFVYSISLFAKAEIKTQELIDKLMTIPDKSNELIEINIFLSKNLNSSILLEESRSFKFKKDRRNFVTNNLKDFSNKTQKEIISILSDKKRSNSVGRIRPLWIANVINCFADKETIIELSNRDDIRKIDFDDYSYVLIGDKDSSKNSMSKERDLAWNVARINADHVWDLGYTGEGVLVSVLDTGINYDHDDLKDHLWEDPNYPNHGYDFFNDDNDPSDDHGHGTHCSGSVAGDGTSGTKTGSAPDATIMGLKILSASGGGQESDVWDAIQFSIEHGVDIMSMSIGWRLSDGPDKPTWRTVMSNTLAAGVIASVAAGNERTGADAPDNIRTPGIAPPPWTSPDQTLLGPNAAVVCVGATNQYDEYASFSSFGPSTGENIEGFNDYPFDPEMGLIRPDVSAPGTSIPSLSYQSNSGYVNMSGTSMATPLVAGVMALMLDRNPDLTPEDISRLLEENVYNIQIPKSNDYGKGIVDALSTINNIIDTGFPTCNIISPIDSTIYEPSSIIPVIVESEETRNVSKVEFYIDEILMDTDYDAPYNYNWNTNGESVGYHLITAIAIDDEENATERSVTVHLNYSESNFFEENFETESGWILTGEFEIDTPQGLGGEQGHSDPSSAFEGMKSLGNDLTGLGSYSGDYEPSLLDRGEIAESPVIDCSSYSDIRISFKKWLNVENSDYDHAYFEVFDGTNWQEIYTNDGMIEDNEWTLVQYNISQYADNNADFKIRFCLGETDGGWQYSGWNVDNIILTGRTASEINYELVITNYELKQNYPNPFNPLTRINYRLPVETMHASSLQSAKIEVYNAIGQKVWSSNPLSLNPNHCIFDGSKFNSGIYYYSLVVDGERMDTKSMVLIK